MEENKNNNQGQCSCPPLDILDASEECCEGYSGIGSTLYIGAVPEGGMPELNPANMHKVELSDAPMWNDKADDGGKRGFSATATMTLDDKQGEAVQKRLLSMMYFNKREIKKMRHLVTHGYGLMFEYTDAEGRDYSVIVGTPRELRQLMERTHRARTNWCRVKSVPVPKTPDELRIATYSRADLLRVYRKYGGCEGCPHRRDNDPDYPEGCECPDELPCLSNESQGDKRW